ncbi:MAG: hypothetical protein V3S00_01210, partial [Dehalococcoidia bacterium]
EYGDIINACWGLDSYVHGLPNLEAFESARQLVDLDARLVSNRADSLEGHYAFRRLEEYVQGAKKGPEPEAGL